MMQPRGMTLLIVVTVIMVAAAVAALATGGTSEGRAAGDQPAAPGLAQRLGDVASVEVRRGDLDLTFVRDGNSWLTAQKSNYPADAGKVRRIVLALADMTLVEPKTREPALYPRLEVEGPGKGKSTLVTIKGKSGADLARVIVGKHSYDRLGEGNDGVYIRNPDNPQSWLARGSLDLADDLPNWLVRRVIDIPDSRVAKVVLTHPDGTFLTLSRVRPDGKFAIENPPKDAKYKSETVLGEPAMALETLELDDVRPATKLPVPDKGVTKAAYTTFDGLTVNVKMFRYDNRNWVALNVTGAGKAASEAKDLDHRVSPWVYAIPAYKAKMLETKLADLIESPKGS